MIRTTPYTFLLEQGDDTTKVLGRDKAVNQARSLSEQSFVPVNVRREDKKMKMLFQHGALQSYQFETR